MRVAVLLSVFLAAAPALHPQKLDPVKWSLTVAPAAAPPGGRVLATLSATLEPGWHLYSLSSPRPSIASRIRLTGDAIADKIVFYQREPKRASDPNFGVETETFERSADFLLDITLKSQVPATVTELTAEVRYSVCDDKRCLPPVRRTAAAPLTISAAAQAPPPVIPAGFAQAKEPGSARSVSPPPSAAPEDLAQFLLVAFGFGLAAIFTPCVFPMIPFTMSYFLNRPDGSRGAAIFQAGVFCLGIMVLFSGLGLGLTAALGASGVVQLGSNPWVNGFITLLFGAFALSLLGAFEITLPSSLLTRLSQASEGGGIGGTLIMGLAFSLTSFACVGPFVGTLLAASAASGGLRPALGMITFAAGLSAPFFLLALFPSYLKRLPKSGGWLPRVKTVMGFVILAAMLKYLSNVDQVLQWNLLTRERFLAAWVVLFSLPGLYLLGFLRMEGIERDEPVGLGRLLTGAFFLIFAISLAPGMFGGRLGEIDAYVPLPAETLRGGAGSEAGLRWIRNDLPAALEQARRENKKVFVNFTGYACTNCHWMKSNMFPRSEIAAALKELVLVELYTDGTDAASEANQKLQESRFQTVAIPFYAILDTDERVVATFDRLTKDPREYLAFLEKGLPAKTT